ncbi:MAG: hypothetical protein ACKPKO_42085, partial [Candidatus Fonsibacter sp.]
PGNVGVELSLPQSVVEHQLDRPGASCIIVASGCNLAVGARRAQRPVADIAAHQQHLVAMLQELFE